MAVLTRIKGQYWPGSGPFPAFRFEPNGGQDNDMGGFPLPPDTMGGPRRITKWPGAGPNMATRFDENFGDYSTTPIIITVGRTPYLFYPGKGPNPQMRFEPAGGTTYGYIRGYTKDSSGNPLPLCTVKAFKTGTDVMIGQTVSDGAAFFSVPIVATAGPFYLVAYLAGSPDVAGTTVNTVPGG